MPTYEFVAKDGERLERFYHASERPMPGEWITHEGKRYERVVSVPQARIPIFEPGIALGLPPEHWAAPRLVPKGQQHEGQPVFHNLKEAREFEARTGGRWRVNAT